MFSESNLSPSNKSGLLIYDQTFEDIQQIKDQNFTIDTDEMERIDKALYQYFGVNEAILQNTADEATFNQFYESVIEPFGIALGEALSKVLLTGTQVRKGNRIMFSSSYLEYASTDSKIKVANLLTTTGTGTRNEVRDIFQLPRDPNGDVYMVRGEYYVMDRDNNIIAESGGRSEHGTTVLDEPDTFDDLDEPDDVDDDDEVSRALSRQISRLIERRLSEISP